MAKWSLPVVHYYWLTRDGALDHELAYIVDAWEGGAEKRLRPPVVLKYWAVRHDRKASETKFLTEAAELGGPIDTLRYLAQIWGNETKLEGE